MPDSTNVLLSPRTMKIMHTVKCGLNWIQVSIHKAKGPRHANNLKRSLSSDSNFQVLR